MTELTEKEAQNIFNATSSAIRENDVEKLAKLALEPEVKDDSGTPSVEQPDPIQPEDTGKETDTPPLDDKSAEKKEEEESKETPKEELTELEKLQAQLAAVSKENHALKSQAGRVPHIQSRLQELDRKLEEYTKAKASPSSQPSTKIEPEVQAILKGIKETDPELADAVAKAIAKASDAVAEDSHSREFASVKAQHAETLKQYQDAETERFLEMYPNAKEVFASPSFTGWKSKQSRAVQALIASDNADDVAFTFEKYATDMLAEHPELRTKVENQPVVDEAAAKLAAEKAKQVETERQRKKETAANVGSSNATGKVELPVDADALFKKFSEEIRKDRTG